MPVMDETCVILNPHAGSAARLEHELASLGPHRLFTTQQPGDATRFAAQAVAAGVRRVVAAGGDGTLNQVLNGLVAGFGRVQLGLLPLGTANDFARSANLPTALIDAVAVIARGRTRPCDVVRLTTCAGEPARHFINASAGGFSTIVDKKLHKERKTFWGALGYAWSALEALPELEKYQASIAFDDEPPAHVLIYNLVVANAGFIGGNIPVAPLAKFDDGLFDVVLFRAVNMARLTTLVPKALLGQHLEDEDVLFRQARKLQVTSQPAFSLNTDGEVVGECPATFEIVPRAIELIVP